MDIQNAATERVYGWSRSTYSQSRVARPTAYDDILDLLESARRNGSTVAVRGDGNSYGDNTLNTREIVLDLIPLNHIIEWNKQANKLRVQPGVQVNDMLFKTVPDGACIPVMPGTRNVTVGGALANNIHGKNCFHMGNFGEHVESFQILLASGEIRECSRSQNEELFYSAVSGLGLLGVTLDTTLRTRNLSSYYVTNERRVYDDFGDLLADFETIKHGNEYAIALIDGMKPGKRLGRGDLNFGNFLDDGDFSITGHEIPSHLFGVIPISLLPMITKRFMTKQTMSLLYTVRHHLGKLRAAKNAKSGPDRISFSTCHFLMDRILPRYNYYFKDGFFEYQSIFSPEVAERAFVELIETTQKYGYLSFMTGVKAYRAQKEPFLLTFSKDGYSMTMDIPKVKNEIHRQVKMFYEMNEIVIKHGGRINLGKTPVVQGESFREMYPNVDKLLELKAKYDPDGLFQSNMYRRIFQLSQGDLPPPPEYQV